MATDGEPRTGTGDRGPGTSLRISVATLGCKVNQFESGALGEALEARGHVLVPVGEPADAVVVNTCTVTHRSDRDARALVRRTQRENPGARILVTGCYAQVDPEALAALGVEAVVGTADKERIPELLEAGWRGVTAGVPGWGALGGQSLRRLKGRQRAFLKVQDGCEAFCAYCIVPYARGPSRSLSLVGVRKGLEELRAGGNQEVVLTGIHLGGWGRDLAPPEPFASLLDAAEGCGIPRVRLSSLEPREVTDEVIARVAVSSVLCPHLHVPLQSGSDRILGSMGRPYTAAEFRGTLERAWARLPDLCVGVDVIVGFPGEDDEAFDETRRLLETLPVAYLHVFPFSPRRGTRAWDLPGRVPEPVIRERAALLRGLSRSKRRAFHRSQLGRVAGALAEGAPANGWLKTLTRSYVPVRVPWSGAAPQEELQVELIALGRDGALGRLATRASGG